MTLTPEETLLSLSKYSMKYTTKAQSLSEQCQKESDVPEVVASEEEPEGFRVLQC